MVITVDDGGGDLPLIRRTGVSLRTGCPSIIARTSLLWTEMQELAKLWYSYRDQAHRSSHSYENGNATRDPWASTEEFKQVQEIAEFKRTERHGCLSMGI
jgi:hypothetical protein